MSNNKSISKIEPSDSTGRALTPIEVLNNAVAHGANPDTLDKLLGLQERWEANQARKSFESAFVAMQPHLPTIIKDRLVDYTKDGKRTRYAFEDLFGLTRQIDPVLDQFGFAYRWRTESLPSGAVRVTCILAHRDGHSEESSLSGPPDTKGGKSDVQGIGSTVSYLQRYTLKAAVGGVASEDDDDALEFHVSEWAVKIGNTEKPEELFAISRQLKASDLPPRAVGHLRSIWAERARAIGMGGAVTLRMQAAQTEKAAAEAAATPASAAAIEVDAALAVEVAPDAGVIWSSHSESLAELERIISAPTMTLEALTEYVTGWRSMTESSFPQHEIADLDALAQKIITRRRLEIQKADAAKGRK